MKRLLLLFLFLPTLSFAEWRLVSEGKSAKKFIDYGEIRFIGDKRRVWIKTENTDSSKDYKSARAYQEFNCIDKTSKLLSLELFSDKNFEGKIILSKTFEDRRVTYVIPDSIDDAILDTVCAI